jgi:CRISPR type III-A-associated RAMP protein Csm4
MPEEDRWDVDGASQCLVPAGRSGPFRQNQHSGAALDRLSGNLEPHTVACLEFFSGTGLWAAVSFGDEEQKKRWSEPVRAAFRLLADSGFGGERGRGWGRTEPPEFIEGMLPDMILPPPPAAPAEAIPSEPAEAYWLLSLFSPAADDTVDWSRGNYSVVMRQGRVDSPVRSGELKKSLSMIGEGSVLVAASPVRGAAPDVAPDSFPHPVYRAGFALAIPVPWQAAP